MKRYGYGFITQWTEKKLIKIEGKSQLNSHKHTHGSTHHGLCLTIVLF